ncbi:MAG: ABC transporter substrate-binding protein, partial [Chloroflexota bacterium]
MFRVSRRQFLRGAAGFGAAAVVLAGCGGRPAGKPSGQSRLMRIAVPQLQTSFDPHNWDNWVGPLTFAPTFDALTFVNGNGELRPALALAWSAIQPTTWQFRLRADVKFQNNEDMDSRSVKLSYDRLIDPANKLALAPLLSTISRIDLVDPFTVNIVTRRPDPILPRRASLVYILPFLYYNRVGAPTFLHQPIGTGLWSYQDFKPGKAASFTLFKNCWRGARGEQLPPLRALRMQAMALAADRASALKSRQVDLALDVASEARALKAAGMQIVTNPIGRMHLWEMATGQGPLANPLVRQALNLAVDRGTLVKDVLGGYGALPRGQLVGKGAVGYAPRVRDYPFDQAQARRLLSQAGLGNGFSTSVRVTAEMAPVANAVAGFLAKVGVQVAVHQIDRQTFDRRMAQGGRGPLFSAPVDYSLVMDADAAYLRYSTAVPAAERFAQDVEMDGLFLKSRTEMDASRRQTLLEQVAGRWRDQALGLPLYQELSVAGARKEVHSLEPLANGTWWIDRAAKGV